MEIHNIIDNLAPAARKWLREILNEAPPKPSKKTSVLLLTSDEKVWYIAEHIKNQNTPSAILNKLLKDSPRYVQDIWEMYKDFDVVEIVAPVATLVISLSPVYRLVTEAGEYLFKHDDIEYTVGDLARGYLNTFLLGQNAVANRFIYGSDRFVKTVKNLDEKQRKKFHEVMILHKWAPSIYFLLSALNLLTNHVDDRLADDTVLKYFSMKGLGLARNAKVFMFTGLGSAIGTALLYGLVNKSLHYFVYGFASLVLGAAYLKEMQKLADSGNLYKYNVMERYNNLRSRISDLKKRYPNIQWEIFYGVEEAIRDYRVYKLLKSEQYDPLEALRLD
ncbi:MAG: hypothetical protein QXN04_08960 [Pyrobaculum sp.]